MNMDFATFFEQATGHRPYPYQVRLASEPWPALLDIPTGLGKTAAVVVSWLHRRLARVPGTPRRLVYCLPMRVLVEQTHEAIARWVGRVAQAFAEDTCPSVHLIMGGEGDFAWTRHPERAAIVVGTQDMLISAALMRAYGASRYAWPMAFGALHNDAQWVMDETQLMGVSVQTSAQLQGLRQKLGHLHHTHTLWMSATLGDGELLTVDHAPGATGFERVTLAEEDEASSALVQRLLAPKPVVMDPELTLTPESARDGYARTLAARVAQAHVPGTLTLVVVNTVSRSQAIYAELLREPGRTPENTSLVHSRFRPADRQAAQALLFGSGDRVVVATQAVEAGVDVSARTLFTELAPWPSLVQRFGRCNRRGEYPEAHIHVLDILPDAPQGALARPYTPEQLGRARTVLGHILEVHGGDVSLRTMQKVFAALPGLLPPENPEIRPVLRRKDLLELFDTSAELGGEDLDISRFVRAATDAEVQVFWRSWDGQDPNLAALGEASGQEICRVHVGDLQKFVTKQKDVTAWTWDALEGRWGELERARPGQTVLLHADAGGYRPDMGWTGVQGKQAHAVPALQAGETPWEAGEARENDADPFVRTGRWVALEDHLAHVAQQARQIAHDVGLEAEQAQAVELAALWHDVGKAHAVFQDALGAVLPENVRLEHPQTLWAKSDRSAPAYARPHFRHELASALAWLASGAGHPQHDLVAYLIAAHHGKVRLSIRSLAGEQEPNDARSPNLFARGVWHGDPLPAVAVPGHGPQGPWTLSLLPMRLGVGSWLERTLALRDAPHLGPFRLAYLELLVRAADQRASAAESLPLAPEAQARPEATLAQSPALEVEPC